jgi:hypothetical protein
MSFFSPTIYSNAHPDITCIIRKPDLSTAAADTSSYPSHLGSPSDAHRQVSKIGNIATPPISTQELPYPSSTSSTVLKNFPLEQKSFILDRIMKEEMIPMKNGTTSIKYCSN